MRHKIFFCSLAALSGCVGGIEDGAQEAAADVAVEILLSGYEVRETHYCGRVEEYPLSHAETGEEAAPDFLVIMEDPGAAAGWSDISALCSVHESGQLELDFPSICDGEDRALWIGYDLLVIGGEETG